MKNIKIKESNLEVEILVLHGRSIEVVDYFIKLFKSLGISSCTVADLPSHSFRFLEEKVDYYIKECKVALVLATFDEEIKESTIARLNVYDEIGRCSPYKDKTIILREEKDGKSVVLPSNIEGICFIPFEKKRIHVGLPALFTELRSKGFLGGEKDDAGGNDESDASAMEPEKPETASSNNTIEQISKEPFDKDIWDRMVEIPAGKFTMGDDKTGFVGVTIRNPFLMDKYPVTQALYQKVMGKNPSHFRGEDLPVENIYWFDAIDFCNELSERSHLEPVYEVNGKNVKINYEKNGYRLPTEAEWEYACRGKTTGERYGELDNIAWYIKNSEKQSQGVGQKIANEFGLYDMLGNVWEWCNDWYNKEYPKDLQEDPHGPENGFNRVLRGGSWANFANNIRSAHRTRKDPFTRDDNQGIRLVLPLNPKVAEEQ